MGHKTGLKHRRTNMGRAVGIDLHMRGHICDMEKLLKITNRHGIRVIEDCAHTMTPHEPATASLTAFDAVLPPGRHRTSYFKRS